VDKESPVNGARAKSPTQVQARKTVILPEDFQRRFTTFY
jgi:hypothetical protein